MPDDPPGAENFLDAGLPGIVGQKLGLPERPIDFAAWKDFRERARRPRLTVRVAVCGKYVDLKDAYKSINESLILAGVEPAEAVKVQVAVMYLVLGSVATTTTVMSLGLSRRLFTADHRLVRVRPASTAGSSR